MSKFRLYTSYDLSAYNSMGIACVSEEAVFIKSLEDLMQALDTTTELFLLGGGSNVLLPDELPFRTIINRIEGIDLVDENDDEVILAVGGGQNWHEFVTYAVNKGYGGIENLALIPGTVGASPIQNIGAYGVELKDTFVSLECVDRASGETRSMTRDECQFGYRDSVFKTTLKDQYVITKVLFRLTKGAHRLRTDYGAIQAELEKNKITVPGIHDIYDAVIRIRQSKLPDPLRIGNTGSFFKNAVVGHDVLEEIRKRYPNVVFYPVDDQNVKIPTGWMIDRCGWKGYNDGPAGVYEKQALVLVNRGGATSKDIRDLAQRIAGSVFQEFGIKIVPEVNIITP